MQCISLWQPYATLLVAGKKRCETRSWAIGHRGPLLIHAAKMWNGDLDDMCREPDFRVALGDIGVRTRPPTDWGKLLKPHGLPFGAIVGRVDVVDCFPTARVEADPGIRVAFKMSTSPPWLGISPTERAFGDFSPGRYAWLCANPVMFAEPVPYRGAQGMFEVPDEVVEKALAGVTA